MDRYQKNPFNHEPTIRLLGPDGNLVRNISQIEAGRLLRADAAQLILVYPPAVQLRTSQSPKKKKRTGTYLHALRCVLYGNYQVQRPDGEPIFKCDREKILWYLNRNLVEIISQDPPVVRLKFNPAGNGHLGDEFYLGHKSNKCVVCGCEIGLNRHHIVPLCYRRSFPIMAKNHSYHDVVLLCLPCHEKYEKEAESLKTKIGEEYNFPLGAFRDEKGKQFGLDPVQRGAITSASALYRHADVIPEDRKKVLRANIQAWTGEPVTDEVVAELAGQCLSRVARLQREKDFKSHGEYVGESLDTPEKLTVFVSRWRCHFLQVMNPQHLPDGWSVEKPIFREEVAPPPDKPV